MNECKCKSNYLGTTSIWKLITTETVEKVLYIKTTPARMQAVSQKTPCRISSFLVFCVNKSYL